MCVFPHRKPCPIFKILFNRERNIMSWMVPQEHTITWGVMLWFLVFAAAIARALIRATDRMWLGCMSMYCSWKRQLLLCESCFAEALELPLESFCVPTLHNPNVNMCPLAESSFWYQALQLFRILYPWLETLTNPTVDNLLYFEIVKVKVLFGNGKTAQRSAFRTYHCAVDRS